MIANRKNNSARQQGVALAFSMVILAVLTLLAVTALKSSGIDEKMSGNVRSQELAFQAAESAIREAETAIMGFADTSVLTGSNGLLDQNDPEPDFMDPTTWATASMVTNGTQIGGTQLASAPRYIVKFVQNQDFFNPAITKGLNELNGGPVFEDNRSVFRVTVQGVGANLESDVVLQGFIVRPELN